MSKIKPILAAFCAVLLLAVCAGCAGGQGNNTQEGRFEFVSGGTAIWPGQNFNDVRDSLGAYLTLDESASCAFPDMKDKVYGYGAYEIYTVDDGKKETVIRITLLDDSVSAEDGLRIGDGEQKVFNVLGEKEKQTSSGLEYLFYVKGKTVIEIGILDGYVVSIQIMEKDL